MHNKKIKMHTITVKNKDCFWVKMKNVENGLGLKWLRGMVENKICGIYEIKNLTKKQRRKYKRTASEISKELKNDPQSCKYVRNDEMEEVIKNCRGVKQCNDDITRVDKEKQGQNFRQLLGFKENEIFETKEYSIIKTIKKVQAKNDRPI